VTELRKQYYWIVSTYSAFSTGTMASCHRQGKYTSGRCEGKEEALGPKHASTLGTVNNLGNLYMSQGKLAEAEKMYEQVL